MLFTTFPLGETPLSRDYAEEGSAPGEKGFDGLFHRRFVGRKAPNHKFS